MTLYLFNIMLEVIATAIRQTVQEIHGTKMEKEKVKVSLFVEDMVVYICDSKNTAREFLQLINILAK